MRDAAPLDSDEEDAMLAVQQPQTLTYKHMHEGSGGEQDLKRAVTMNLHGKRLASTTALEECPNLRSIDLSFNLITNIEGLSMLSKLKELKLYDNRIVSLSGLHGLTNLHTLDISSNRLASLEGLKGLRGLRVLRAAHNALPNLDSLGRWASSLESLEISHNNIQDLNNLTCCTALRELNVAGNAIGKGGGLRGLSRCAHLEELYALGNGLTSLHGLKAAAPTLDILDVSSNCLASLEGLPEGCTNLHELYASDNNLKSISGLARCAPNLETLDVGDNPLAAAVSSFPSSGRPASPVDACNLGSNSTPGCLAAPASNRGSTAATPLTHRSSSSSSSRGSGVNSDSVSRGALGNGQGVPAVFQASNASGVRAGSAAHSVGARKGTSTPRNAPKAGGKTTYTDSNNTTTPVVNDTSKAHSSSVLHALVVELKSMPELTYVRLESGDGAEVWGRSRTFGANAGAGDGSGGDGGGGGAASAAGSKNGAYTVRYGSSKTGGGARAVTSAARQPTYSAESSRPGPERVIVQTGQSTLSQPGLQPKGVYHDWLFTAVPHLETVDEVERPVRANVWVNTAGGTQEAKAELDELLQDVDLSLLQPSAQEMEDFKRRMGIRSSTAADGLYAANTDLVAGSDLNGGRATMGGTSSLRASQQLLGQRQRPSSALGRPAGAALRHSLIVLAAGGVSDRHQRGGMLRPPSSSSVNGLMAGRPQSSGGQGLEVKDIMMHQRPPSARSGGASRLMTPQQYTHSVVEFGETLEAYRQQLTGVLSTMREGLKLDVTEAMQQAKAPGGDAARQLPSMPVMPQIPSHMLRKAVVGGPADRGQLGGCDAADLRSDTRQGSKGGRESGGLQDPPPSDAKWSDQPSNEGTHTKGLVRIPELDDPQVASALAEFHRLFPSIPAPTPAVHQQAEDRDGSNSRQATPRSPPQQTSLGYVQGPQKQQQPEPGAGRGAQGNSFGDQREEDEEDDDRGVLLRGGGDDDEDEGEDTGLGSDDLDVSGLLDEGAAGDLGRCDLGNGVQEGGLERDGLQGEESAAKGSQGVWNEGSTFSEGRSYPGSLERGLRGRPPSSQRHSPHAELQSRIGMPKKPVGSSRQQPSVRQSPILPKAQPQSSQRQHGEQQRQQQQLQQESPPPLQQGEAKLQVQHQDQSKLQDQQGQQQMQHGQRLHDHHQEQQQRPSSSNRSKHAGLIYGRWGGGRRLAEAEEVVVPRGHAKARVPHTKS